MLGILAPSFCLRNTKVLCLKLEAARESVASQLQAFGKWLDEEEGKQAKVAAHEEPVLQSSTISARVVQLRNAFEKLNKKKKPAPPPVPKQQANMTNGTSFFLPTALLGKLGLRKFGICSMCLAEKTILNSYMPFL